MTKSSFSLQNTSPDYLFVFSQMLDAPRKHIDTKSEALINQTIFYLKYHTVLEEKNH